MDTIHIFLLPVSSKMISNIIGSGSSSMKTGRHLRTQEYPVRGHESQAQGTQDPSPVCHDVFVCLLGFTASQWLVVSNTVPV